MAMLHHEHETVPHLISINIGGTKLWFCRQVCIAFRIKGELVIRENTWIPTDKIGRRSEGGRHLNFINPDKSIRLSNASFVDRMHDLKLIEEFDD